MSFPFFVSSVALSWCHVFSRFSTRFSTRFQAQKKRHREGHATPFHTLVPRSSLAVPGTPSATSQRSQFVDATGTLWQDWAPSPVCYGAPHRHFGSCWQCGFLLVFPCFLCCHFGSLMFLRLPLW